MNIIDTHAHLDGEEFRDDLPEVIARAQAAGVSKVFLPCINLSSIPTMEAACRSFPGYLYPMIGLQPEEVRADWQEVLAQMKRHLAPREEHPTLGGAEILAVGEVGLDFYWTREFEQEQLLAFEEQVKWAVEFRLPLVIHCRKAQNELLRILKLYRKELVGGVFHCFTGNGREAEELLALDGFVLGIGGVSTFKSSHLREDLPAHVPLSRIVLETDSPYMAPVPHRGRRNESSFLVAIQQQLAASYGVSEEELARQTNENVRRVFHLAE